MVEGRRQDRYKIDNIVERNYRLYGFFFSVYNHPDRAVASRRGLPTHLSEQMQEMADDPSWDMTAVTWVLWSKILASNWQASITLSAGWTLLFALMERLVRPDEDGPLTDKERYAVLANTYANAPSFEAFVFRWWLEATIYMKLNGFDSEPLTEQERRYLTHYRQRRLTP